MASAVAALVRTLASNDSEAQAEDSLLTLFGARARRVDLAAGCVLCREGDAASSFWIVLSGRLRVELAGVSADSTPVETVGAQAIVGESALLREPGARRNATLVASEPTELLEIPTDGQMRDALRAHRLYPSLLGLERMRSIRRREVERRRQRPPHQWRTLMFLPQFAFDKAYQLSADCFIVDFQDAVPLGAKKAVRSGLLRGLSNGDFDGRPIVVRINETALPEEHAADLDAVIGVAGITALMPTMIERPDELDALDAELTRRETAAGLPERHTKLLVLMETPAAILRADSISRAGGGRILGLMLGHGDLFRLTGAEPHTESTLDWPRNQVVFAARAAGVAAFDTPFTHIRDLVGLEREARAARRHGFDGKCCLHPSQLSIVGRCLRPSPEKIAWARRVERARATGALQTLTKRLGAESLGANGDSRRGTDGMALVDGQLVGPPHIKAAQHLLAGLSDDVEEIEPGRIAGRVVSHALAGRAGQGDVLPNPYEITITAGMRDLWQQCFFGQDPADTSAVLANTLGLSRENTLPVPFMMGLYLCVSMSSTHGAIYHLGFSNAVQLAPLSVGDTVRQRIEMVRVRNTSDGGRAVVTTRRTLIRVPDDTPVFRVEKLELYPTQPAPFGDDAQPADLTPILAESPYPGDALPSRVRQALADRAHWPDCGRPTERFEAGEILLHSFARPLGVTANLALSTQFLVTHPIHLDHHRYDLGDGQGVVVSGGLVISQALGAMSRDITHVLSRNLVAANNLRPVAPTDTISALSRVLAKAPVPGAPELEVLVVRTLGLRNITAGRDLVDAMLPTELFDPDVRGVEAYESICRSYGLSMLEGRIVCDAVTRLLRIRENS